ncbi:hypothetical protein M438DRAFT_208765 [Aureobasidium pullulans EXF-150]|uniref:Uncharacterized protein n=1 Tax=Aureobasidium pullulans EXF-150 TaxID=1043002 RepID=A0A074XND2_AURPU|nr:uncharacterized protein M438DRAFT_208765 [Aureobasidium pullulans EXF-150]KEQ85174.1 hypothetical protein M438DRAFT_208765 [Aureobasidium pullulans EXF-150]
MPTTHAFYGRPTLLRMTLTMTIDDCFAFAFLMIAVLLSSVLPWLSMRNLSRFEGVVVIAEEKEDAYELQFPCGQRRAYMPVRLMMTLTRQKTILKVSLPRCSALSSLSLGRQRRGTHMRLAVVALANGGGSIMQSERQEQCEWQSGLGL